MVSDIGFGIARPRRLGARTRKGFLVVHIVSAGAWIGIDVVMAVVVFTALLGDDETRALCYRALELFAVWPLITTGLLCLASGVVLGVGTKWGLVRYWWVATKLALNVLLGGVQAVGPNPRASGAEAERAMSGANQEIHDDTTRREWGLILYDLSPINSALYLLRPSEGGPSGAEVGR